jgi:hypothetical protein
MEYEDQVTLRRGDALRETTVYIAGRKIPGYPTVHFNVTFTTVEDLLKKIDFLIDGTDFGKVDVCVTNEEAFTPEEIKKLETEWITFM